MPQRIFSHRYARPLREGELKVDMTPSVRRRLWKAMQGHNHSLRIQRDPYDNWTDNTDVVSEVAIVLKEEHAWDEIPGTLTGADVQPYQELQALLDHGAAEHIIDAVEIFYRWLGTDQKDTFLHKINGTMELEECPWRFFDGEMFKLDPDFVGARANQAALEGLSGGTFAGAMAEYTKAQREQASLEIKDAIADACKSYESVLKVLTGLTHVNADPLTKAFLTKGYLDDLPEDIREGFRQSVLMALPFLRNKLAGHGQGAQIVDVPPVYGTLALQLAAALHNFLIAKHVERRAPELEQKPATLPSLLDDVPF